MNESTGTQFARSQCAIANTLELFGDKWSLLIIRDLILGKARYGEFAESPEGIPTNILASRLKQLETFGVITKQRYCEKPVRYQYHLTDKGKDLIPVLETMAEWSLKHVPGVEIFPRYRAKEQLG